MDQKKIILEEGISIKNSLDYNKTQVETVFKNVV